MEAPTYHYRVDVTPNDIVVAVDIDKSAEIGPADKGAVFYYRFLDENYLEVMATEGAYTSKKFGYFVYVDSVEGSSSSSFQFRIPDGAVTFEGNLIDWNSVGFVDKSTVSIRAANVKPDTSFSGVSASAMIPLEDMVATYPVSGQTSYRVEVIARGVGKGQALMLIEYEDSQGERLVPQTDTPVHPKFGQYIQIDACDSIHEYAFELLTPPGASTLRLKGKHWRLPEISIAARPSVQAVTAGSESFEDSSEQWLSKIGTHDDVAIIHTTASSLRPSNSLLLRSNRMAIEMAQAGWKVVFIPFSGVESGESPRLINEHILQIESAKMMSIVNSLIQKSGNGRRLYICSSRSDVSALAVQNRLQDKGWKTLYETRDDMEEFQRVGYSKWYRPNMEVRFAQKADAIIATSPRLRDRISVISGRSDIKLIANAAPDEFVRRSAEYRTVEHFERERQVPVVGYLGHLTESWFDWQTLLEGMKTLPEVEFEIIGHGMPKDILLPSNAKYLGAMAHPEAIERMRRWRVGLIPFTPSRLTYGVDPNKVYEYVAMGLRTVSAPMGDFSSIPGVETYENLEGFTSAVRVAAHLEADTQFFESCETYVDKSTWSYRIAQFLEFVERDVL